MSERPYRVEQYDDCEDHSMWHIVWEEAGTVCETGVDYVDQEDAQLDADALNDAYAHGASTTREAAWRAGAEAMREAITDEIRISTLPMVSTDAANFPLPPCPPREGDSG